MRGSDLKATLAGLGWSQRAFADRIDVDPDTVSRWATDKSEMPGAAVAYLNLAVRVRDLLRSLE